MNRRHRRHCRHGAESRLHIAARVAVALGRSDQAGALLLRLDRQPRPTLAAKLIGLPEPVVGESFSTAATRPFGRILAVEPTEHLTGEIMGACISYVLVPQGQSTSC